MHFACSQCFKNNMASIGILKKIRKRSTLSGNLSAWKNTDEEIDPENWKYSIDTDGYNNISVSGHRLYQNATERKNIIWEEFDKKFCNNRRYLGIENYKPSYVLARSKKLKK